MSRYSHVLLLRLGVPPMMTALLRRVGGATKAHADLQQTICLCSSFAAERSISSLDGLSPVRNPSPSICVQPTITIGDRAANGDRTAPQRRGWSKPLQTLRQIIGCHGCHCSTLLSHGLSRIVWNCDVNWNKQASIQECQIDIPSLRPKDVPTSCC